MAPRLPLPMPTVLGGSPLPSRSIENKKLPDSIASNTVAGLSESEKTLPPKLAITTEVISWRAISPVSVQVPDWPVILPLVANRIEWDSAEAPEPAAEKENGNDALNFTLAG